MNINKSDSSKGKNEKKIEKEILLFRNLIPIGKQNAIHMQELANKVGVTPETLKHMIRRARLKGEIIISGVSGYWYGETEEESKEFITLMRLQAAARVKTIDNMFGTKRWRSGQNPAADESKRGGTE